jgi:hypothetical protein
MVGAFDADPLVQTLQHYPTFLNVDKMPEDTYERPSAQCYSKGM